MAANRKGIGPTTLKRACNSTTNTCTKYLLVVMHKTLCSVWLTFVRRENETMANRIKQLEKPFPPVDIIMDDFEQHKKSNDKWCSPPFYTHLGGYRMCLRVDANGDGSEKGTHVSGSANCPEVEKSAVSYTQRVGS